jgi:PAS domain S-box-containing protein
LNAPALPALVESHPDAAWIYDRHGRRLLHANPAAIHMGGLTLSEQQQRPVLFQFPEPLRERLSALLRRREPARVAEAQVDRADGLAIPVELTVTPADDQLIVWCRDMTDRVHERRDHAWRLRMEKEARNRAEADKERLEFLSAAGRQLAGSLDYPSTLACVARLAVPRLANWCVVDVLIDDDTLRREAVAHQEPDKVLLACELQMHGAPGLGTPSSLWKVLSAGRHQRGEVREGEIAEFTHDPVSAELVRHLGVTSYIIVPLQARGRMLGCMTFATTERAYQARDVELAEGLARQAALAMDNAVLYRECSGIADMLERSLLLPEVPRISGLEMAVHYEPAWQDTSVGGDFYDISETPDERWAITLGDMRGKGLPAATLTALARYTLRAASLQGKSPAEALDLLNQALVRQDHNRRSCTAVYGLIKATPEGARVVLAVAGHPLPWVLRHDGSVESVGRPGRLMGLYPNLAVHDTTVLLAPGDALILYTDGITEARLNDRPFEDELPAALTRCRGLDAQAMVSVLEQELMDWSEAPSDDRALLVVRVPPVI